MCPERKAVGGTGGWQAGCTVGTLSRCLSNLGALSLDGFQTEKETMMEEEEEERERVEEVEKKC